ncbi:MAG: CoA pyrophosphatase [Actinobacteria bacterium]|nr:CoA pyrophosphatase [Actinomycetota bacterium]
MRGGPQVIPRPDGALVPGPPAPWAHVAPTDRMVTLPTLADVLDGRVPGPPEEIVPIAHRRASGVLVPLYEDDDGELRIILTRRTAHLRTHKGEVAFPGGGQDPDDASPLHTALREAWEEIGLPPEDVRLLGPLDPLATLTSGALINPFVGVLPRRPRFRADPNEVAAVLDVAVRELLDDATFRTERWPMPPELGSWRDMYFFDLVGDTVWGATARMLVQFLRLGTGT